MLPCKQDGVRGQKAEGTLGNFPGEGTYKKQRCKANTDGWRCINTALSEQGEKKREGRIKEEERTELRGDKMCL